MDVSNDSVCACIISDLLHGRWTCIHRAQEKKKKKKNQTKPKGTRGHSQTRSEWNIITFILNCGSSKMTHTDRGHCRQHESPPIQRQLSSKTKDGPLCWKAIFPQVFNICDFKIWQRWIEKVKAYLTMVWTIQKYSTTCHRQSSCIHFFFFTIRETDLSPWVMLNRSSLIHGLEDIKRQKNKKKKTNNTKACHLFCTLQLKDQFVRYFIWKHLHHQQSV